MWGKCRGKNVTHEMTSLLKVIHSSESPQVFQGNNFLVRTDLLHLLGIYPIL